MAATGARLGDRGGFRPGRLIHGFLGAVAKTYLAGLAIWLTLHVLFDDRWWWLDGLTVVIPYVLLFLPVVGLIAGISRRREIWLGFGLCLTLSLWHYGGLFLPKFPPASPDAPQLTIMTYNLLGSVLDPAPALRTIRAGGADLVALQELNPPVAEAIRRQLAVEYPYQLLDPAWGTSGMGTISRYPIRRTFEPFGGVWNGAPHVLELDLQGRAVAIVNGHATPRSLGGPEMERWNAARREDAAAVADYARRHSGPMIVCVDLNGTDLGPEYQQITRVLGDVWRDAGWGPGHTWSLRPAQGWWFRIDYVFASSHFQAQSAEHGLWDGHSDHRPVVVRLALTTSW